MRLKRHHFLIAALLLRFATLQIDLVEICNGQEDATSAYKKISPSVVALSNAEGSGTGIILNDEGYVLTNAHVVASPLLYRCKVEFEEKGELKWKEYAQVVVLGTHPRLDLAIVKINPAEHDIDLIPAVLAPNKGTPGQTVYAVGNPSAGGNILRKTITAGLLSGVDRDVENEKYYQFDAAINPGNSGGPLIDTNGHVLGIVTFKSRFTDNVGFAIPMHDFSPKEFGRGIKSEVDKAKVDEQLKNASHYFDQGKQLELQIGEVDYEVEHNYEMSIYHYQRAINFDPTNPNILYNCGICFRGLKAFETAEAYILQSLRLDPWFRDAQHAYRELGLILSRTKRRDEAAVVYLEGLAKYPRLGAKVWEDWGAYAFMEKDYSNAAYRFAVTLRLNDRKTRLNFANDYFAKSIAELDANQKKELRQRILKIEDDLAAAEKKSKAARDKKSMFLTNNFEEYLKRNGGIVEVKSYDLSKIRFNVFGKTPTAPTKEALIRKWKDASGRYEISAELVNVRSGVVKLKKLNGKFVSIPLDKLSKLDQAFVSSMNSKEKD